MNVPREKFNIYFLILFVDNFLGKCIKQWERSDLISLFSEQNTNVMTFNADLCSQWRRAMPSDIIAPDATETTMKMTHSSTSSEMTMATSMTTTPTSVSITAIDYMVTEARKRY